MTTRAIKAPRYPQLTLRVYQANSSLLAEPIWEEDLGEDPMGSILRELDAAERMEVEVFMRLGGLIA
ncbi:uncharacterized protein N7479_007699 [Penicillium vulpinum]|uniref:uncharacterized protein n=1 Tax=Penicillium vulpinum TaxID=29845 RepID=UPI0025496890|nr:uncharacterized protein N7479_007699 [Penicillium vulpinum]KAJ5960549.1 hypothetical protein N7479_007699 [Penicillium vulpinum]